jgi:hypothetical protein
VPSIDLQVSQSADDTLRYKSGDRWDPTGVGMALGYFNLSYKGCGGAFRFQNVTISQGATIITAYLTVCASANDSKMVVNTKVRGEAADNAAAFSTQANFDARNWTDAEVDWTHIEAFTIGNWYQSSELKTIIQEIVNRANWEHGNALVLVWDDWDLRSTQVTETFRRAYQYDSGSDKAAKLHVEFERIQELAGVSAGVCSVSAFAVVTHPLAGIIQGMASVSGFVVVTHTLAGVITGVCSVAGSLINQKWLRGTITGVCSVAGSLINQKWLRGTITGVCSVAGSLINQKWLAGVSAGVATVTGALCGIWVSRRTLPIVRRLVAKRNLASVREGGCCSE